MGEDLPAVRITPTYINDAYKCNTNIITCNIFPCSILQELFVNLLQVPGQTIIRGSSLENFSAKKKMLKNVTVPFTEIPTMPGSQIFLCTVLQGLDLHPWVKTKSRKILCHLLKAPRLTEFASLVSLLTDFDKSGEQRQMKMKMKMS